MDEDVCVVTQPLGDADTTATGELLAIVAAITDVSLVTIALSDEDLFERYDVTELDTSVPSRNVVVAAVQFLRNQLRMCAEVRRRDEAVVHFFGPVAYVLPVLVARLSGKRVVVQPRANVPLALRLRWERRLPAPVARALAGVVWLLERVSYRLAHAIVTYTPRMATELDLEGFDEKLHTNGARFVDTDRFTPQKPFAERRRLVGYLGRLDEEKGVRSLVGLARALPADVTLRVVGDGALREWVATELRREIDAGHVELEGWVDHERVPEELSAFRLLVVPSHATEGLPTTILEAFACGTPAFATPVSGVPDVVREGETGALIESRDPEAMARRIESVLDEYDLASMSRECRALVEAEYTFDAAVRRYERIYDERCS